MERFVVILDDCPEYAEKLSAYLNESKEFLYRAVPFSSPEEVRSYIESGSVSILVVSLAFERELLQFAGQKELRLFWLTEEKERLDDHTFYRYGSVNKLCKRLCKAEKEPSESLLFTVLSISGADFLPIFAKELADGLSKQAETLFLPFYPFDEPKEEAAQGMSELLFYLLQNEDAAEFYIKRLERKSGEAAGFSGVRYCSDLFDIKKEHLKKLFFTIQKKTDFSLTVAGFDYLTELAFGMLELSTFIFLPYVPEEKELLRVNAFYQQMNRMEKQELLSRIIKIPVQNPSDRESLSAAVLEGIKKGGEVLAGT